MRQRVLWVIKGLGPGGAEHLLSIHARHHDRAKLSIECAYVRPDKDHLAESLAQSGVATHCIGSDGGPGRWVWRLARLVRSGRWDVVHVHSPVAGSVARLATRTLPAARRPLVLATEHNTWASHRTPTRLVNRFTSRWNTHAFAVTDDVLDSVTGPGRRSTETLRHGIDVATVASLRTERAAVRSEFGLDANTFVIGTVANFRPQKDYPTLLRSARVLVDRGVNVHVLAVGQGPDAEAISQLVKQLGLDDQVTLTGFRADAARVMAAVDVFVLASRWEGLPLAVMEALALGLPIVTTAVGGMAEHLLDGTDALLVPPSDPRALADAVLRVAEDPTLAQRLADGARSHARAFDAASSITRIEQEYLRNQLSLDGPEPEPAARLVPPRKATGVEIRPATADDRAAIIELCRSSLGWGDDPRFEPLFAWKHDDNPFGRSFQWVAVSEGEIVGLRAFMRWDFVRGGTPVRAVRAVDTAVRPDHHGRGLFTALTLHGLDEVDGAGIDFVFNTPNQASRPGYVKMGWQLVGRVPVSIRLANVQAFSAMARSRQAASHWPVADAELGVAIGSSALGGQHALPASVRTLRTDTTAAFLDWRYGLPMLGYRALQMPNRDLVVRLRTRGRSRELVLLDELGTDDDPQEVNRVIAAACTQTGATHALLVGRRPTTGWIPANRLGPTLAWRGVRTQAMPPQANWHLAMRDIELF